MFKKVTTTYLLVGLGNPDKQYLNTFHNVGFMAIDLLAQKLGIEFVKGECRAITATYKKGNLKIILAKPITYMNLSGESVFELVNKYKIERDKFLVVYDDVDLPIGHVRIRQKGSGGTHNGMRNIVDKVNTTEIFRVRVGIGQSYEGELYDYVLKGITQKDKEVLLPALQCAAQAMYEFSFLEKDIESVMRQFNG